MKGRIEMAASLKPSLSLPIVLVVVVLVVSFCPSGTLVNGGSQLSFKRRRVERRRETSRPSLSVSSSIGR